MGQKKNPTSWKAKYQARSQEIADAKRERDKALEAKAEMETLFLAHDALFESIKENFGTDALTIFNTYTRKMKELDEREQGIISRMAEVLSGFQQRQQEVEEQCSKMIHDAGNTAQSTILKAENDAEEMTEKAKMLVDEAQAAIDAGVEAKTQHLNELKGELERYDAALDHRNKDVSQREKDLQEYEFELDSKLLEIKRIEQYIKDTMGDAPIKKMRKRLHEKSQEIDRYLKQAGAAKREVSDLKTENRKLQIVVNMSKQQSGKQRDTIARQGKYIGDLREEKGLDRTISTEELFYATSTPEEIEEYDNRKAEHEKQHDEAMMGIADQYMQHQAKGGKVKKQSSEALADMKLTPEDLQPYIDRINAGEIAPCCDD